MLPFSGRTLVGKVPKAPVGPLGIVDPAPAVRRQNRAENDLEVPGYLRKLSRLICRTPALAAPPRPLAPASPPIADGARGALVGMPAQECRNIELIFLAVVMHR